MPSSSNTCQLGFGGGAGGSGGGEGIEGVDTAPVFADEDADALVGDDSSIFAFESERDRGNGASGASPPHAARVRISSNAMDRRARPLAVLNPDVDLCRRQWCTAKFVNGIVIARSSFAETQRDIARLRSTH